MAKKNLIKAMPKSTTCNIVLGILLFVVLFNVFFGSSSFAKDMFGSSYREGACSKKKKLN